MGKDIEPIQPLSPDYITESIRQLKSVAINLNDRVSTLELREELEDFKEMIPSVEKIFKASKLGQRIIEEPVVAPNLNRAHAIKMFNELMQVWQNDRWAVRRHDFDQITNALVNGIPVEDAWYSFDESLQDEIKQLRIKNLKQEVALQNQRIDEEQKRKKWWNIFKRG